MATIIVQPEDWIGDVVTIPVDEYIELQQEVKFLRILESYGIDNWEPYQLAVRDWRSL